MPSQGQDTSEQPEQPLTELKCKGTVKSEKHICDVLWRENRTEQRVVLVAQTWCGIQNVPSRVARLAEGSAPSCEVPVHAAIFNLQRLSLEDIAHLETAAIGTSYQQRKCCSLTTGLCLGPPGCSGSPPCTAAGAQGVLPGSTRARRCHWPWYRDPQT